MEKNMNDIIYELINNKPFINEIKDSIINITNDNKINILDIPDFINILVIITNNYQKINKSDIDIFYKILFLKITDILELHIDDKDNNINKILDICINLIKIQVKTKKWYHNFKSCLSN